MRDAQAARAAGRGPAQQGQHQEDEAMGGWWDSVAGAAASAKSSSATESWTEVAKVGIHGEAQVEGCWEESLILVVISQK